MNGLLCTVKVNFGTPSVQLVTIYGTDEQRRVSFYWGTGPSRTSAYLTVEEPKRGEALIIEEHGLTTRLTSKQIDEIELDMIRTHYSPDIHKEPKPDENGQYHGWVSPEGDWVVCPYGLHDALAVKIMMKLYGENMGAYHAREKLLNDLGWIQVRQMQEEGMIVGNTEDRTITQAQVEMLKMLPFNIRYLEEAWLVV